jgi:hypothetical protein
MLAAEKSGEGWGSSQLVGVEGQGVPRLQGPAVRRTPEDRKPAERTDNRTTLLAVDPIRKAENSP